MQKYKSKKHSGWDTFLSRPVDAVQLDEDSQELQTRIQDDCVSAFLLSVSAVRFCLPQMVFDGKVRSFLDAPLREVPHVPPFFVPALGLSDRIPVSVRPRYSTANH